MIWVIVALALMVLVAWGRTYVLLQRIKRGDAILQRTVTDLVAEYDSYERLRLFCLQREEEWAQTDYGVLSKLYRELYENYQALETGSFELAESYEMDMLSLRERSDSAQRTLEFLREDYEKLEALLEMYRNTFEWHHITPPVPPDPDEATEPLPGV